MLRPQNVSKFPSTIKDENERQKNKLILFTKHKYKKKRNK